MELNKIAKYQAKNEPYLKPISDLGIGFYNLDENTATLQFRIYNNNGPLLISDENVDVHGYFESSNGSVSTVLKLKVVDGMNGIAQITLDKDFLQASTSTKVTGQIYVAVNNVTDNPNNNQTAVLGEFTFQVADALINTISSFTKVEYIRMFDQLREEIKQRTKGMEDDIGNIKTLVNEVKDAVADGKADITKVKNDSISELEDISNTTNASVRQQASQAISDIQSIVDEYTTKLNDETNDKINEVNEASDKVLESIKQNNLVTSEQTDNWQKYKLTNDSGMRIVKSEVDAVDLSTGYYLIYKMKNDPDGKSDDLRYVNVDITEGPDQTKQILATISSTGETYKKNIHKGIDSGWKEFTNNQTDTGWIPYSTINGVEKDTVYKNDVDRGFDCAYRIIKQGNITTRKLRVNARNLTQGIVFAKLPTQLTKNTQTFLVRTPRNRNSAIIEIKAEGKLVFQYYSNTTDWIDTDYIYGEFTWHD